MQGPSYTMAPQRRRRIEGVALAIQEGVDREITAHELGIDIKTR